MALIEKTSFFCQLPDKLNPKKMASRVLELINYWDAIPGNRWKRFHMAYEKDSRRLYLCLGFFYGIMAGIWRYGNFLKCKNLVQRIILDSNLKVLHSGITTEILRQKPSQLRIRLKSRRWKRLLIFPYGQPGAHLGFIAASQKKRPVLFLGLIPITPAAWYFSWIGPV